MCPVKGSSTDQMRAYGRHRVRLSWASAIVGRKGGGRREGRTKRGRKPFFKEIPAVAEPSSVSSELAP